MKILTVVLAGLLLTACTRKPELPEISPEERERIIAENSGYREERTTFLRDSPSSPFQLDTSVTFHPLSWYDIDPAYRGYSKLYRYDNPPVIEICATGGEIRRQIRYGYFALPVPDSSGRPVEIRLNVYTFAPGTPSYSRFKDVLSIWFTDETTALETYGVGRYVDVGDLNPDPDHIYTIDLNQAYNPYCAYSSLYSCAIPSEEDHLPVAIRAGEKYEPY